MQSFPKKILQIITSGSIFLSIALPIFSFAENTDTSFDTYVNFCAQTTNINAKIYDRINTVQALVLEQHTKIENTLNEEWAQLDQQHLAKIADADALRESRFKTLTRQAKSKQDKERTIAFEKAITDAVTLRRGVIDTETKAYRKGILDIYLKEESSLHLAADTFIETTEAFLAKAKHGCAIGIESKTVRETYIADLKKAEETFKTTKQKVMDITESIQALTQTQKEKFAAAQANFETTVAQAKIKLEEIPIQ